MKLTELGTGLRITNSSWIWGALGFPLTIFFIWQSILHIGRGGHPGETVAVIFGAILAGSAAVLLTQWSEFQFDTARRTVFWKHGGFIRSKSGTIVFDRIKFAVVQFMPGTGSKELNGYYRVVLSTDDGIIPLSTSYNGGTVNDKRCREIRSTINELIGIKLVSADDNDVLDLDRSGKRDWAMRFISQRFGLNTTAAFEYLNKLSSNGTTGRAV